MGRLRIKFDNQEQEKKFREAAKEKFGSKKGALSKCAEEAILNWIKENTTLKKTRN